MYYSLITTMLQHNEEMVPEYGIVPACGDAVTGISFDRDEVEVLLQRLNDEGDCAPWHLQCIVEDWLAERYAL